MSVAQASTGNINKPAASRFSLIILEPGEIYFEDYLVYYHGVNSPLEEKGAKAVKGSLKICSKSLVFDPISLSEPLIKFPYKAIERIEQSDEDKVNYSTSYTGRIK